MGQLLEHRSLEEMKLYLNELLTVLSRTVIAGDTCGGTGKGNLTYLANLIQCREGKFLYEWLDSVIDANIDTLCTQHLDESANAVTKAIQFIETNFRQEVSLSNVSDFIYLNPQYFSRMFKEKIGVSFVEYLTQFRVNNAKQLLAFTNNSINAIAEEVGIRDANYFSRVFKKTEGVTPSEYRLKNAARLIIALNYTEENAWLPIPLKRELRYVVGNASGLWHCLGDFSCSGKFPLMQFISGI